MSAELHAVSIAMLVLGAACALGIAFDVAKRPQPMGVMNVVWPVVALFGTVAVVWFYARHGRAGRTNTAASGWVSIAKGALHCGSGCTLGDLVAESVAVAWPPVLAAFGWPWLFGERMFAVWAFDFVLAFVIGIAFQYFAIAPMRHLGLANGLVAALEADTLSLVAWQLGMYGFMALVQFVVAPHALGGALAATTPEFWFAMQLAMICGFATSLPVNAWLVRAGIKEAM